MIEFIKGAVLELTPAEAIIDGSPFGFQVQISLQTHEQIKTKKNVRLFTHMNVKNEGQSFSGLELYGFATKKERAYFRTIIGVSGIGTATARLMLSSLSPKELSQAILLEKIDTLTQIKGIGPKTAKRMILELKDKLPTTEKDREEIEKISTSESNTMPDEALSALSMLGFSKKQSQKAINKVLKQNEVSSVEELVKLCLKKL